jgi:hypothetical protein
VPSSPLASVDVVAHLFRRATPISCSDRERARPAWRLLWCNARTPARRCYERAGLQTRGEPWDDPEIGPHVAMWREL